MVEIDVGARIKKQRESLGLSQEDLARSCSVHKMTVSKWERNESSPEKKIVELSDSLGRSVEWILTGKDDARVKLPIRSLKQHRILTENTELAGRLRWQYYFKVHEALRDLQATLMDFKKSDRNGTELLKRIEVYSEIIGACLGEITNLDPVSLEEKVVLNEPAFIEGLEESRRTFLAIQLRLNRNRPNQKSEF